MERLHARLHDRFPRWIPEPTDTPRSVSSIWWGGEHTLDSDEHTVNLRIVVGKKPGASVKEYRTAGSAPAPGRTRRPTGLQRLISRSHYDFVEVCLPCRIMCCIHYTS
jgi:hypothetical protein